MRAGWVRKGGLMEHVVGGRLKLEHRHTYTHKIGIPGIAYMNGQVAVVFFKISIIHRRRGIHLCSPRRSQDEQHYVSASAAGG